MIRLTLSGGNLEALGEQISERRQFRQASPDSLEVDYVEQPVTPGWPKRMPAATKVFEAVWEDERRLALYKGLAIEVTVPVAAAPEPVVEWLDGLDFELASFQTLHPDWRAIDPAYVPPSFANRHRNHGPFAAIKGAGHRRLVSDRWLDYCPVKVIRSGELSLVQFHDLAADAAVSLAQAKPGHIALSSEAEGGVITDGYLLRHDFNGFLDQRGVLKIGVMGRTVPPREMLDACALRGEVKGKMVHNVAFTFLDENDVGNHLYQLWVRGLECWTVRDGREVRLDDSYAPPPPSRPPWAQ